MGAISYICPKRGFRAHNQQRRHHAHHDDWLESLQPELRGSQAPDTASESSDLDEATLRDALNIEVSGFRRRFEGSNDDPGGIRAQI